MGGGLQQGSNLSISFTDDLGTMSYVINVSVFDPSGFEINLSTLLMVEIGKIIWARQPTTNVARSHSANQT